VTSPTGQDNPRQSPRLILASASPRRKQLLQEAGYRFAIDPANIDEDQYPPGLSPGELAQWLALRKAELIADRHRDDVVLGADTVVALGSELLGKPSDPAHAQRMLRTLSGTTHDVITGVAVLHRAAGFHQAAQVFSRVQMRALSEREISDYVASNEWQGKAGGYGIQDADPFVTRISGDLTNIVGLPMEKTMELLAQAGIPRAGKSQGTR
jgi:septum formation protein